MFNFIFFSLVYFEASAATGQGVAKAVEYLLDKVMISMEQCVDKGKLSRKMGRFVGNKLNVTEIDSLDNRSNWCGC